MRKKLSKRLKKLIEVSKDKKTLIIDDAIGKVKNNCTTKFNESIDVSLLLNLKKKNEKFNLNIVHSLIYIPPLIRFFSKHSR